MMHNIKSKRGSAKASLSGSFQAEQRSAGSRKLPSNFLGFPRGKKGIEQPQLIVYVLFTIILTLLGIYVAFTYLGGVNVAFDFQDYASRLNIATSNIIDSPKCFAFEKSYTSPAGTFYQVDAGTIDWTKFNSTDSNKVLTNCTGSSKSQVWAELVFLDSGIKDTIWSCPPNVDMCVGDSSEVDCSKIGRKSLCDSYEDCKWITCDEPTGNQFVKEWAGENISRYLLVQIQNGSSVSLGKLQVRIKE